MKKKILFSLAAVAMVAASLTFNSNVENKKVSAIQLSDLMQTASATVHYAHGGCTDPFINLNFAWNKNKWWPLGGMDVPCDNSSLKAPVCLFGLSLPCAEYQDVEQTVTTTNSEGQTVTTTYIDEDVLSYYIGIDETVDVNDPYYNVVSTGTWDENFQTDWVLFNNSGEYWD